MTVTTVGMAMPTTRMGMAVQITPMGVTVRPTPTVGVAMRHPPMRVPMAVGKHHDAKQVDHQTGYRYSLQNDQKIVIQQQI